MKEFDVVIIGSGPGGYICAIRCAQLGMKTAIIEKYNSLGGVCLNVGCIPSKAWLDSSEKFHELSHTYSSHGISAQNVSFDFLKMKERVQKVVSDVSNGVSFLMKKNKIEVFKGTASFIDPHIVLLKGPNGDESIRGNKIVVATGSKPSTLPGIIVDKERIITSTEALFLKEVPKALVVIGGGAIGLELSSVYKRLGSEVTIIEFSDYVIPSMDLELGKNLQRILTKDGMKFVLGHSVTSIERNGDKVFIKAKNKNTEQISEFEGDYCLVAVGRRPYIEGLDLEKAGVKLDNSGRIETDVHLQTNIPHIFALGDVAKGAMLAHKAEEEGIFVAELMAGQKPHINYKHIPSVVYTSPEVSSVGYSEEELKRENREYKVGSFSFRASGRARAANESNGFVKVLADKKTDEILGVHMMGPRVADIIAEAVVAMEYQASAEDIARVCHAHPTYSEAFKEACLAAADNRALNI